MNLLLAGPLRAASGGSSATTADKVASYLIRLSQEHGDPLTNLKLQKLLYYAQGWHLALRRQRLFADPLEAWIRGPVVSSVWRAYRDFKWQPISTQPPDPKITPDTAAFLRNVYSAYENLSGFQLQEMTHREPPWLLARRGLGSTDASNVTITASVIEGYFLKLASGNKGAK